MQSILEQAYAAEARARARARAELDQLESDALAGDVESMYCLAYDLGSQVGGSPGRERELQWYARAAEAGHVDAPYNLGLAYDDLGNYRSAREWYERAVALGDSSAMSNLGRLHEKGDGCEVDVALAGDWYRKAIELDNDQARCNLAFLLRRQDPVANAYRVAELMREAAEAGRGGAIIGWAELLWSGAGVDMDRAAAGDWMRSAAGMGSVRAEAWLRVRNIPWIDVWTCVPGRSIGPLQFADPIENYMDLLRLSVDGEAVEADSTYDTPHYSLWCQTEEYRLVSVCSGVSPATRVRLKDLDLMGQSAESVLSRIGSADWKIDEEYSIGDYQFVSERLGLDLEMEHDRVISVSASLEHTHPLWS